MNSGIPANGAVFSPADCYLGEDGKLYVFDGQHRIEASWIFGIPVKYIIINKKPNITDLAQRQSLRRSWRTEEFLNAYISWGCKGYKKFNDFRMQQDITIDFALIVMSQRVSIEVGDFSKFQRGELDELFLFYDYESKIKYINQIKHLISVMPGSPTRSFIKAASTVVQWEEYNHKIMVNHIKKYQDLIPKKIFRGRVEEWIDLLCEIYSKGSAEKIIIPFTKK